jgi:VWFA-related protein
MWFTLRRRTARQTADGMRSVLPPAKTLRGARAEGTGPQLSRRPRAFMPPPSKTLVTAAGFAWLAVVFAVAQSAGGGQAPSSESAPPGNGQPAATVSVHVNVVNVLATVRDKHGKIINDLGKDDFIVSEDGRPQTIRYFTKESDLPLTLGLLVDTSLSQRRVLDQERSASHGFLDQMLRVDKDQAFIIHFDREVELLQDLTSSRNKLEVALEQLQTPQLSQTSANDPSNSDPDSGRRSRRMGGRGGTLLYDAVYLASDEVMSKQQGRKALVVLSDGVDHGSKETLESAIATAQRSDTVVYSILFKDDEREGGGGGFGGPHIGMGGPGMGGGGGMGRHGGGRGYPRAEERPDGKKVLERISKETGGRMFEVSKKDPIDQIYDQIAEELRSQYSLGYTPDRAAEAGPLYRKIQLTTKPNGLVVQTRDGYYAGH